MGYYIFSRAIDFNEVKQAFNSKNDDLFNKVLQTDEYDCYSSQEFDDCITTKDAIKHIIYGEPYVGNNEHVYGYAFICLCACFGKEVPYTQEIKLGYETDLVNDYLAENYKIETEIEEFLFAETPETGLPAIKDWPLSGIANTKTLQEMSALLNDINILDETIEKLWESDDEESEDKAVACGCIMGIKSNIQFCLENNLSLISFCH